MLHRGGGVKEINDDERCSHLNERHRAPKKIKIYMKIA